MLYHYCDSATPARLQLLSRPGPGFAAVPRRSLHQQSFPSLTPPQGFQLQPPPLTGKLLPYFLCQSLRRERIYLAQLLFFKPIREVTGWPADPRPSGCPRPTPRPRPVACARGAWKTACDMKPGQQGCKAAQLRCFLLEQGKALVFQHVFIL